MKKIFVFISIFIIIFTSFTIDTLHSSKVKAASIGEQLKEPENGWKRYDDANEKFLYSSGWKAHINGLNQYNSTYHSNTTVNETIKFKFKGTKLRILGTTSYDRPKKTQIEIDGVKYFFSAENVELTNSTLTTALLFEKTDLEDRIHEVTIKYIDTESKYLIIDAFDIDDNGTLLSINDVMVDSLNLNKETVELDIGSSEALIASLSPETATNKLIKWVSSNPEIATVDDNGNVIGKSVGKVTITAETTDGSNLKASAEVTVKEAEVDNSRGIVKLTTTTGDLHEYDLSKAEIDKFIAWLDKKEEGKPYYEFKLNVTTGNIKSRTEYIMYDEIVSFLVDEY